MKKLNFIKKIIPACLGIVGIGAVAPIVSTTINVSKSVSNSGKTINVEINNPPNFNPAINAQKTYSFYSDTIPEDITNIGVDEEGYVYTNMGNWTISSQDNLPVTIIQNSDNTANIHFADKIPQGIYKLTINCDLIYSDGSTYPLNCDTNFVSLDKQGTSTVPLTFESDATSTHQEQFVTISFCPTAAVLNVNILNPNDYIYSVVSAGYQPTDWVPYNVLYNIGTVVSDVYVTLVADIFYSSYYWNNHHMWALFSRLEQFNSWNNESYSDAQIPSFPYHTSFLFSSKFTILDDSATNYNIGDVLDIRYVDNNHFETKIDFSRIQISGMNQPTFGFAYTGMSLWDPSGGYGLPDFSQSWTSD